MAYNNEFLAEGTALTTNEVAFMNGDNTNSQPEIQVDPITMNGYASKPDPA